MSHRPAKPDPFYAEIIQLQHETIDMLLARIIQLDPEFFPSESAAWPAVVAGKAALDMIREP